MQRSVAARHLRLAGRPDTTRFGTWHKALAAFVERVNSDNSSIVELRPGVPGQIRSRHRRFGRRTPPDVSRMKAGAKDAQDLACGSLFCSANRFRCVACGSSPATHAGCALHVDHIMPFSKGGKTLAENLRTLCADCNIMDEEIGSRNTPASSARSTFRRRKRVQLRPYKRTSPTLRVRLWPR